LNTRCDPAERPIPFEQEISQHIGSTFARITSVEPEVHERTEIVYSFSPHPDAEMLKKINTKSVF
jgi:hypothetical protein